jgi:catechol 2,3-dioxygenase-like lactoylglutathione lyase family enzyme
MLANYNLLYVDNPSKSRDFYADLFGQKPVEDSETFALFVLPNGLKFGLWKNTGVVPAANRPGGFELGLPVDSKDDVDRIAADWQTKGIEIIQEPENMDFGRTFTALDPDGHRLRVLYLDMGQ